MDENQPSAQPETPVAAPAPQPVAPMQQEVPKKLVNEVKSVGSPLSGKIELFKSFVQECKRVLRVTKKPNKEEFMTIVKISAAGMAIIGVLGFLIQLVKELLI